EVQVDVDNGSVEVIRNLDRGANELILEATIDSQTFSSDTLLVTRRQHPLGDSLIYATVTGSDFDFRIELHAAPGYIPPDFDFPGWSFDSTASTTGIAGHLLQQLDGYAIEGTATGPGELYFDVDVRSLDGTLEDVIRVDVLIQEDGSIRRLDYAETASWINRAVVYEIFPLTFGPEASGTPGSPGKRFDEITAELDYIAQMGFTTIWFMPIFHNQVKDGLSDGYNTIDFNHVDPKLGTNDDFRELVERAHELGLRIILDITPNHVSPVHPWVESVRQLGE